MFREGCRTRLLQRACLRHSTNNRHLPFLILLITFFSFTVPAFASEYIPSGPTFDSLSGWTVNNYSTDSFASIETDYYTQSPTMFFYSGYNSVHQISISADYDFTDVSNILFDYRVYDTSTTFSVYIDGSLVSGPYFYSPSNWNPGNISVSSLGLSGVHKLKFFAYSNPSSMIGIHLDNLSFIGNLTSCSISSAAGVFEYGNKGWYSIVMEDAGLNSTYYVDVYGLSSSAYTFLNTYSFNNTQSGYNIIEITAPVESLGYTQLYAVLRNAQNVTYSNTTDPLVIDAYNYFYFVPSVIGYEETSTLYYEYNCTGKYYDDTSPYQIRLIESWDPYSNYHNTYTVTGKASSLLVDGLLPSDSGSVSFGPYNFSHYKIVNGEYVYDSQGNKVLTNDTYCYKYGLFRDTAHSEESFWLSEKLFEDTLIIDANKETPSSPVYTPGNSPDEQANDTVIDPEVPDPYIPPFYPNPSDPSDPDIPDEEGNDTENPDYNPAYNDSTSYDEDNHSWGYDNTSGYNGTDGYFPVDVPGNTTVDTSRFQGFYDFVDSVYSPLNNTVYGFLTFVLSPVSSMSRYVSETKTYFDNSTVGLFNGSVITECIVPVFTRLPPIIIQLIVFSLCLSIIGLLLRGS